MPALHVLRVFVDDGGEWGNPLGVFLDGQAVPAAVRQETAAELGFSETVFVDDLASGRLQIFTPGAQLEFAGHPLVGTVWLLDHEDHAVAAVNPPAGRVRARIEDGIVWITAPAVWAPHFVAVRMDSPAAVDALEAPPADGDEVYAWAWVDESAGTVRARGFAPGLGIPEDEATGSAALALSDRVGREITIRQGNGSVLHARALGGGLAEVGGAVVLDERRDHPV